MKRNAIEDMRRRGVRELCASRDVRHAETRTPLLFIYVSSHFFFTNFTYRRVLNRFWCLVPLKRVSDHSETHPTSFPPSSAELVPSCHQVDTGCVCECVWVFFFWYRVWIEPDPSEELESSLVPRFSCKLSLRCRFSATVGDGWVLPALAGLTIGA